MSNIRTYRSVIILVMLKHFSKTNQQINPAEADWISTAIVVEPFYFSNPEIFRKFPKVSQTLHTNFQNFQFFEKTGVKVKHIFIEKLHLALQKVYWATNQLLNGFRIVFHEIVGVAISSNKTVFYFSNNTIATTSSFVAIGFSFLIDEIS